MVKLTNAIVILLLLFTSCSKDSIPPPVHKNVIIYPNPFTDLVYVSIYNPSHEKVELSISDYKGDPLKYSNGILDSVSYTYAIDFSDQSRGAFICEVLIGNEVQRITLYNTK